MATVVGKTSIKIDDLIESSIISGEINGLGHLILTTRGGAEIDAGVARPPDPDVPTALDFWPIGAVYISVVNTSPATLFGGSWSVFGTGRVLIGVDVSQAEFDTVMETGGEKTHTLTASEMPAHVHSIDHTHDINARPTGPGANLTAVAQASGATTPVKSTSIDTKFGDSGSTGGGTAHNNLPPYVTAYFWRRTA